MQPYGVDFFFRDLRATIDATLKLKAPPGAADAYFGRHPLSSIRRKYQGRKAPPKRGSNDSPIIIVRRCRKTRWTKPKTPCAHVDGSNQQSPPIVGAHSNNADPPILLRGKGPTATVSLAATVPSGTSQPCPITTLLLCTDSRYIAILG